MRALVLSVAALAALLLPAPANAEPTDITVRVLGKDSKFIGTSMGGARIILRDAETGEVLASGVTATTVDRDHEDRRLLDARFSRA